MKVNFYCSNQWLKNLGLELERKGHTLFFNQCNKNADVGCNMSYVTFHQSEILYRRGFPVIEYVMDIPSFRVLKLWWRRRYLRYGARLKKASVVAAISNVTVIDLWNYFNVKAELCKPYIDRTRFDAYSGTIPKQQIIQISRFSRHKNMDMTIRAAELIGDLEVIICGIGNADKLKKSVKKSTAQVHIIENAPDELLVTELKNSIALVSPSSFEGFGLTPLEALYSKVPVVITDLPVFREIYGDIPLYHKNRDVEDMADKIRMLIKNSGLGHVMVQNIEPVLEHFTLTNFADRFEKLLYIAVEHKT